MTSDKSSWPIPKRFEHLLAVISGERFLKKEGLGNEVPFFICPFKPQEAVEMEKLQRQLANRLEQDGIRVIVVNLYDLSVELIQARGIWDQVMEMESSVSKDELKELLQNVTDPREHLVPAIGEKIQGNDFDVLFLTGVGEVFPYVRSHNVLNNLQSTAKDKPTVMFFPGTYTQSLEHGASLDLFGCLHDDKYYRAFDIYHYEP